VPRIRHNLKRLGLGLLQIESHASTKRVHDRRVALIGSLIAESQTDVLRALQERIITIEQLDHYARENPELGQRALLGYVRLVAPLDATIDNTLPLMGKGFTQKRYGVSAHALLNALLEQCEDPEALQVASLRTVDWEDLKAAWLDERSPSDWMHMRRFLSRFLTILLGGKTHPMRLEIMARVPYAKENERVPDLSPDQFLALVEELREDLRPAAWTIVLTGMRAKEYLACDESNLLPATYSVRIPGTKTDDASGIVQVPAEYWAWIEAGVPSRLRYKWLRIQFMRAANAIKKPDVTLHSLRHCYGQWAADGNVPEARIQRGLRHTNPRMTRRYTASQETGAVSEAVGRALTKAATARNNKESA